MIFMLYSKNYIGNFLFVLLFLSGPICYAQKCLSVSDGHTGNPFMVSYDVEPDYEYNQLLRKYLYSTVRGEGVSSFSHDSLSALFGRPSFKMASIEIMNPENAGRLNVVYPESLMTWDDSVTQVLLCCTNDNVVYEVADSLLATGYSKGMIALWDECDVNRLISYPKYFQLIKGTPSELAELTELAIINHNSDNRREVKRIMRQIGALSKDTKHALRKLLRSIQFIDYTSYLCNYFDYLTFYIGHNQF